MIVKTFKGYSNAIQYLIPNIRFNFNSSERTFIILIYLLTVYIVRWKNVSNRRILFENYAKENRFNHMNPTEWYQISRKQIMDDEVHYFVNFHVTNLLLRVLKPLYQRFTEEVYLELWLSFSLKLVWILLNS